MYRRSPRWVAVTWRSRAAASIKAERPSGYPRQCVGDRQASFHSGMTPTSRPRPLRPTAPQCTHRPPRPAGASCALFAWLGYGPAPSGREGGRTLSRNVEFQCAIPKRAAHRPAFDPRPLTEQQHRRVCRSSGDPARRHAAPSSCSTPR